MLIPITIVESKTQRQKEFIPLTHLDLPVELIAKDGTYYLLWIRDDEEGEWWVVTKLDNPADALAYVKGKISAQEMLKNKGITKVTSRPDNDHLTIDWDEGMSLEQAQQELNLLLPTEDSYLELENSKREQIVSLMIFNVSKEVFEYLRESDLPAIMDSLRESLKNMSGKFDYLKDKLIFNIKDKDTLNNAN